MDLINSVRVRSGLKALAVDSMDTELAASRSKDMRDRNYFSHYTPENVSPADQARKMGIKYTSLGENIAYGEHNAIFAHEAFMDSPEHRSNVLMAKYTKIGYGRGVRRVDVCDTDRHLHKIALLSSSMHSAGEYSPAVAISVR